MGSIQRSIVRLSAVGSMRKRLFYLAIVVLVASVAMISFMFLVMVRVDDPLVPRAIFGVLNTLLFFPSGAV